MKRLLTAAAALSMLVGAGAASAQPGRHDDRHDDHRGGYGLDRHDDRGGGRHWNRGQRLDNRYGAYAPVNDWRSRRLPTPRRGYHWVRSGDDYVQAALVGGLIASVIAATR